MTQSIYDYNHARDQIARAVAAEHQRDEAIGFIEQVAQFAQDPVASQLAHEWLVEHGIWSA
jgi:nuclear transport factor 2 (NTF2) superfamily protein